MAFETTVRKPSRRRWWIIIAVVVVLAVVGAGIVAALGGASANQVGVTPGWTLVKAESGSIEASVSATGNVAPQAQADLRFSETGRVIEILVKPGDDIKAGQPLARLDPIDARLRIASAEADYAQAQAAYEDLIDGAAAEDLRDAEAKLAQAKAQYEQTLARVSNADITAARARVEQARIRLSALQGEAKSTDIRDAEAQLQRAQLALQTERDRLSQAKTSAELALERAVADLARAQQNYATAKANWDFVQETGQDPTNPESTSPTDPTRKVPNKLSDTQRQQYYDTFVSAEASLRTAEVSIRDAQVSFDAARQAEVIGVQSAEQQLASAQAAYDKVKINEPAALAEARAALASAQAELNRLIGDSRASDLAAAQASLDAAQLDYDKLNRGPTELERAKAQADLARAELTLKQAQRTLEQMTLTSPFDAKVARVDLRIGEQAGTSGVVAVVDMRSFHIDVPVDELDIPQIKSGQNARIVLDALPGTELAGVVTTISPLAVKTDRGTNTYAVTVEISGSDPNVKPGMTATVQLITTRKEGVVLVPRRALQTEAGQTFVYVPSATPQQPPAAAPGAAVAPGDRHPVTLGLSNAEFVEITSGLQAGESIYVPDVVQTFNPFAN
ncbi:MAG: efflux RND transporter periplasmic adaptor subunit [Roseiflexaceae bacterium]